MENPNPPAQWRLGSTDYRSTKLHDVLWLRMRQRKASGMLRTLLDSPSEYETLEEMCTE
jgi:hypothetical protein